ncbi:hypothetical protein Enr10x_32990 [Gimesia panareensis]|uniref:Uncharacterized protein n=1 Tax=Gimesia panareensis TaxID=2527978 RepID=A0A517Q8I7_9PLAN|nr:hypothetical protein Enr10x_32990 [Gimesia panareensis]
MLFILDQQNLLEIRGEKILPSSAILRFTKS